MARILIIDDDLMVSKLLSEHLTNEGYEVITASMAEDGFNEALKNPPDLIFLDVNLPDATGFQMVGRFRKEPKTLSIPIFMMTGAARWPNQQAIGKQMGANEYILKPFDVIQVGDRVHNLMGNKRPSPKPQPVQETPSPEPAPEIPPAPERSAGLSFISENSFFFDPPLPIVESAPAIPEELVVAPQPEPVMEIPAETHAQEAKAFEEERYFKFSVDVLILVSRLPKTRAGRHLADQLLRCGTAVGAKIQELQSAESEQETRDIMKAALKNLRESAYWLMLIRRGNILEAPSLDALEKQCEELINQLASKNQPVS